MFDVNDNDDFTALDAGLAYGFYRHGQDQQAAAIINGLQGQRGGDVHVEVTMPEVPSDERPVTHQPNVADFSTLQIPDSMDEYIGQEPLKRQMTIAIKSAQARGDRLPHTLLASGFPGVGKTTMARLIAKVMGVQIYEIQPPFGLDAVVEAAMQLDDGDILFIDEIHKLAETGKRGSEFLLAMLEAGVVFLPSGEVVELPNITVIGATTDKDMLPEPVIDRFKVKPYFQPYSLTDLSLIAQRFAWKHGAEDLADDQAGARLMVQLAAACRSTPRIVEEMIMSARDLWLVFGAKPTGPQVLEYLEVEHDGLTRTHIQYLTTMRQFFPRIAPGTDDQIEYVTGEAAIQQALRETKQGLRRVENFLIERGLIDRTPRGRRLTERGIARAEEFISQGKGASSAA